MQLDKRSHDLLLYRGLKNYWDTDRLGVKDLRWMVEYLEDRCEYYVSPIRSMKCSVCGSTQTCQTCKEDKK